MFKKLIQNIFFSNKISEQEVLEAQKEWAYYIINIGKLYLKKGNYKVEAKKFVTNLYAYEISTVLFKLK